MKSNATAKLKDNGQLRAGNSNRPLAPATPAPRERKKQEAIARMVDAYGTGFAFYADSPAVLGRFGLTLQDITPAALSKAASDNRGIVELMRRRPEPIGTMAELVAAGSDDKKETQTEEGTEMHLEIDGERAADEGQLRSMLAAIGFEHAAQDLQQNGLAHRIQLMRTDRGREVIAQRLGEHELDQQDRELYEKVLAALKAGKTVKVISNQGDLEVKAKKNHKKAKAERKVKPDSKPNRGPGVLDTILECLKGASKNTPITRDEILKELTQRFPERKVESMKSSLSQASHDIKTKKGYTVQKDERGMWLSKV